jgi:hypothetical protein
MDFSDGVVVVLVVAGDMEEARQLLELEESFFPRRFLAGMMMKQ